MRARRFGARVWWVLGLWFAGVSAGGCAATSTARPAPQDGGADTAAWPDFGAGDAPTETAAPDAGPRPDAPVATDELAGPDTADAGAPDLPAPPDVGVSCTPWERRCVSQTETATCGADGRSWGPPALCADGEICVVATGQCTPSFCRPWARECTGPAAFHICLEDGSAWSPEEVCEAGDRCDQGRCLAGECVPAVMFLVDRSSSMAEQWDDVQNSIRGVVAANPSMYFGVSAFPARDGFFQAGCTTGDGWPHVPIQGDASTVVFDWFSSHEPNGATPLAGSLEWMSQNVAAVWGGAIEGSYLVVLSDGEDTCSCGGYPEDSEQRLDCLVDEIAGYTQALAAASVRTYVIGYNYWGDPEQLNAIAANGGTSETEYIPAGSEESLTNVFERLMTDMKLCL